MAGCCDGAAAAVDTSSKGFVELVRLMAETLAGETGTDERRDGGVWGGAGDRIGGAEDSAEEEPKPTTAEERTLEAVEGATLSLVQLSSVGQWPGAI